MGDFYIYPRVQDIIYATCPLCGSDGSIYGGNRWYTQACCYFHVHDTNINLEVEQLVIEHLLAGESIDEVHARLTALRKNSTLRDYVERISAILSAELSPCVKVGSKTKNSGQMPIRATRDGVVVRTQLAEEYSSEFWRYSTRPCLIKRCGHRFCET